VTDRELLERALEAWESPTGMKRLCELMDAIRAHLDAPEQEPVAWSYTSKINGDEVLTHQPPDRVIEPEQFHIQPLYLHPAPIPPGMVQAAYAAGFSASGEGYNAEYPFGDKGADFELDENWCAGRDAWIAAAKKGE
jgi:hypothetical protein